MPSRLVISPEQAPEGGTAGESPPLDERRLATLQELMRASVEDPGGTAHALLGRGPDVAAVAGSAAYGPEGAATRHVWCTGYRGNLAFAVLVEGTSAGPEAATGVAARLLTALPTT
jgi:hypothetical protein